MSWFSSVIRKMVPAIVNYTESSRITRIKLEHEIFSYMVFTSHISLSFHVLFIHIISTHIITMAQSLGQMKYFTHKLISLVPFAIVPPLTLFFLIIYYSIMPIVRNFCCSCFVLQHKWNK